MRSVVQEASSLSKAIELGWIKAGKPREFNVKIYEEPKKNFFGFTTQKAKVGIFIRDRSYSRGSRSRPGQPRRRQYQTGQRKPMSTDSRDSRDRQQDTKKDGADSSKPTRRQQRPRRQWRKKPPSS